MARLIRGLAALFTVAQTATAAPPDRPLGVELDLVQPFVPNANIIKPKLTARLWQSASLRGDLVLGAYIRPHIKHDVLYEIDEYMLVAGYRQYLWRGLHAEALIDGGLAWGTNRFDQQFYRTPTLFLDASVGYRFLFEDVGFYVAPQGGVIGSLGISSIGPRNGKPDWFLQGNLLVGYAF